MLKDLFRPSRITQRAEIAVEALQASREAVVAKVNAMAATPLNLEKP